MRYNTKLSVLFASFVGFPGCVSTSTPAAITPTEEQEPLYVYYDCRAYNAAEQTHENFLNAPLTLFTRIREDGDVLSRTVQWAPAIVDRSARKNPDNGETGYVGVTFTWPAQNRWSYYSETPEPFSWDRGSLQFSHLRNRPSPLPKNFNKKRPWRQTIIDRGGEEGKGALLISGSQDLESVIPIFSDLHLMTDLTSATGPNFFTISLKKFLLYADEAPDLTIYHTAVARGKKGRGDDSPPTNRIILSSFKPDVDSIRKALPAIEETADSWFQARLVDHQSTCERGEFYESDDVIIVTDADESHQEKKHTTRL